MRCYQPIQVGAADAANAFARQACFAIDYDFSTHKCYFFGTNLWTVPFPTSTTGVTQTYGQIFFHCPVTVTGYQSLNVIPNPNTVHITFCTLHYAYSIYLVINATQTIEMNIQLTGKINSRLFLLQLPDRGMYV